MRDLEDELGVELFDRKTRPPRLNAHGQALVEQGRDLLTRFDTLAAQARSPGEIGGRLMLGCVSGVSSGLIPEALASLRWERDRTYMDWKGLYWDNPDLLGQPLVVRDDPLIDFDWYIDSPDLLIPVDHFSAAWEREIHL